MMLNPVGKPSSQRRDQREELLSAAAPDPVAAQAPPRMMTEGERGLAQLQETARVAADTERLGMSILGQLADQRGQLEGAIETRQEAQESLGVSSRLIRQMHRRAVWMKISLCAILLFLVIGVFVIVYLKWLAPEHHDQPHGAPPSMHGRALTEELSPPPPPPIVGNPPPPPTTVADTSRPLGPGIIILIVVGSLSVAALFVAIPRPLVQRTFTCLGVVLLCLTTALVLFLMPRDPLVVDTSELGKLTDVGWTLRYTLVSVVALFCLIGAGATVALVLMDPIKAPKVPEPERVEAFRLKS